MNEFMDKFIEAISDYSAENRIAQALAIRGLKQVDLCEKTGLKKASVSGWIKQKYQPKSTALYLMAKVLDVSELWLAGYDVPMEKSEAQKRAEHLNDLIELLENNDQYVRIIEYIVKLDENKLDAVEKMLSAFIVKEN